MFSIVAAQIADVPVVMNVIEDARQLMRNSGNYTQWINGYPSIEVIENDIESNQAFLCVLDTKIVGYFCFMIGDEPNYHKIENGNWLNHNSYGVIHRLASSGEVRGVAQFCFDWAFTRINNIRVDTNNTNLPMQNFLKKNDFTYCGVIYVNDGSPRDAFQKSI